MSPLAAEVPAMRLFARATSCHCQSPVSPSTFTAPRRARRVPTSFTGGNDGVVTRLDGVGEGVSTVGLMMTLGTGDPVGSGPPPLGPRKNQAATPSATTVAVAATINPAGPFLGAPTPPPPDPPPPPPFDHSAPPGGTPPPPPQLGP